MRAINAQHASTHHIGLLRCAPGLEIILDLLDTRASSRKPTDFRGKIKESLKP